MSILLIMSGAYLNAEFTAEFGQLPPTFLPVGNRRLYEWQLDLLSPVADRIVMALPGSFTVSPADAARLADKGVEIVSMPVGLSLGAAVVYCLNVCHAYDEPVYLLHGDTLVDADDLGALDAVLVAKTSDYYVWAGVDRRDDGQVSFHEGLSVDQNPREVLCGYFTFSDPSLLIGSIVRSGNDFIAGIDLYTKSKPLTLHPTNRWLDFGHVQLYFQSKSHMTTQRAFNMLNTSRRSVFKSSEDEDKIRAEAAWFERLPEALRIFVPTFMGAGERDGRFGYRTEYLRLPTLSELLVFGRLPAFVWQEILDGCEEFLSAAAAVYPAADQVLGAAEDHGAKTLQRLETFIGQTQGIDLDAPCCFGGKALPSLRAMVEQCNAAITPLNARDVGLWHGDFCFSNLFYDFRSQHIKVVDPRGRDFLNHHGIFGDRRYDLAKLSHSVLGQYDFIIAGHYDLQADGPISLSLKLPQSAEIKALQAAFSERTFAGIDIASPSVRAMTVLLFLSMLPLHADNPQRQQAMLANGMRLFAEFVA